VEILIAIGAIIIIIAVIKSMFKLALMVGGIFLIYYLITNIMA